MSIFILDCGSRGGTFYFDVDNNIAKELPNDDVININIPNIKSGDILVIEDAHIRTREKLSLAQPFSYQQLCSFKANAEKNGVSIKLFPQMSTPKARDFAGGVDKNDINDVQAIAAYLTARPSILSTLKKLKPKILDEYRKENEGNWKDKDELSTDINAARNFKYGDPKEGDYTDAIIDWVNTNIKLIYETLTDDQLEMLQFKVVYKGKPKERIDYNRGRMYTIVATLIKADGGLRLRSDVGKLPYWKYVKEHYFGMTPYHMKGGVAASNVKYHWRRHASGYAKTKRSNIIASGRYDDFTDARSQFDKDLRKLWNVFRGLVLQTVL